MLLKILGDFYKFQPQYVSSLLTTLILWGLVQSLLWLFLLTENQAKKDYRKYKIKTVVGPDDYASMREVIRRRYGRVQRDGLTPPDLIVIDGGQGQVNIAKQVIQDELGLDIPIAGLQKNDKHQTHELLFGDPLEVGRVVSQFSGIFPLATHSG